MLLPKRKSSLESIRNYLKSYEEKRKPIVLDDRVDEFIKWYADAIKGRFTAVGDYQEPIELRDFIEKMAVWYELKYPDYEIVRLMPGDYEELIHVNDVMFNQNDYFRSVVSQNSEINIDWNKFYNYDAFMASLPWKQRYFLRKPEYDEISYWEKGRSPHVHLSGTGIIELAEYMNVISPELKNEEIDGMHISSLIHMLHDKGIKFPQNCEFEETCRKYDVWVKQYEGMLDCVMYRIIERGGNRMGPRRAFLFAKEFKRNIEVPMKYGVDPSDPGLRKFIIEYIKAGGNPDLVCYKGYFSRTSKYDSVASVSIRELLRTQNNNAKDFYTEEEDYLHQKLVDVLVKVKEKKH